MAAQANKIRKTISDAQLKDELIKLFEAGQTGKTDLYGLLRTKIKLGRGRYFKTYDETLLQWQQQREKAQSEQVRANASEQLKSGLKSKTDRLLELQKMLEDDYTTEISMFDIKSGKLLKGKRKLTPGELIAVNAEISKMNGDYSPKKMEHIGSSISIIIEEDAGCEPIKD